MTRRNTRLAVAAALLALPACMQKMADQPYYRPLDPSGFFTEDSPEGTRQVGSSARPLIDGTVSRGDLMYDNPLTTGLTAEARLKDVEPVPPSNVPSQQGVAADPAAPYAVEHYVEEFPFEVTAERLERGKVYYSSYCAMCHGPLGNGEGKIWERGIPKPTSFVGQENSRGFKKWGLDVAMNPFDKGKAQKHAPNGYFFEVITRGYGAMGSYSAQLKPDDRWNIVAYIRALQYSRSADLQSLPEEYRKAAGEKLGEAGNGRAALAPAAGTLGS